MSFQWTVVAGFLYLEIAICLILCLPFIGHKRWHSLFKSNFIGLILSYGNVAFIVVVSILCLLFADALREVRKYGSSGVHDVNLENNPNAQDHVLMMLFRAQRNLYISGFALFLFIVLRRMCTLLSIAAQSDAKAEASHKQAESASRTAQALMDDKEKDKDEEGDNETNLQKEIDQLKSRLTEERNGRAEAEAKVVAIKAQAESTNREYDRLMKEHAKLQESSDKKDD